MDIDQDRSTATDTSGQETQGRRAPVRRLARPALDLLQPFLTFLLLVLIWQVVVRAFDIPRYLFPAPTDVVEKGIRFAPRILDNYWPTFRSALIGYGVAVIVAIPIALLVAFSSVAQRSVYPGLVVIHMTPKVTLAPLVIAWLGFGIAPKVTITALLCFMPIVLNGILGFRSIDPEILYLAKSAGAGRWETFWKLRLPNALPHLFTGLKHGASLAVVGAVVAEYIGGNEGLAYYLLRSQDELQIDLGIAIMVVLTTIGLLFFSGMHLVESLAIPWHVSKRRATSR